MKKNTAYTIGAVIVLFICAFCFVALPAITSSPSQGKIPVFGSYNGREIKYEQDSDFFSVVAQDVQIYEYQNVQITSKIHKSIFQGAFQTIALKYAYEDFVKKSGYIVPKSVLTKKLIDEYYSENGQYSSEIYKQIPDSDKIKIRKATEESLNTSRFYDDFFGSDEVVGTDALYGLKESDAELDFLKSFNSVKRGFDMAIYNLSDFPTEEKVKYAKDHSSLFVIYDLSIITVKDKSTAQTISKRLANNEITFEDAITEYATEKPFTNTEGKFNGKYQYQLEYTLNDKADLAKISDLPIGVPSEVIQTVYGYSIFKHNSLKSQPDFEDDSVIFDINSYINNYERNYIEDYFIAKGNDFAAHSAGLDFAEACALNGAEYVQLEPFPLNYGNLDIAGKLNTSVESLAYEAKDENFLKTAFSLSMNEFSSPILAGDSIIVLKYTTEEKDDDSSTFAISALQNYDSSDINNAIFKSDKLKNNFGEVYNEYFTAN
ncbi:MAG: hypothetical protein PUC37_07485 [Spirochaetales bacterium]|nr:hypothetical protein [Spirochaetales bacterium]